METLHKQWHNLICFFLGGVVHPLKLKQTQTQSLYYQPKQCIKGNSPQIYHIFALFDSKFVIQWSLFKQFFFSCLFCCCFLDSTYHGFSLSTLQASENWQTDWEHTAASVKSLFVGNIEMYESESIEIISCIYVVWLHKKTCLRPVVAIDGFQHTLQPQYT